MYKLETENFSLELLPGIHQDSFPYPKANSLRVKVSSLGFSADSIMDIDDIALSDFAVNLYELYETLSGSVRLEEPYSMHCFLQTDIFALKAGFIIKRVLDTDMN